MNAIHFRFALASLATGVALALSVGTASAQKTGHDGHRMPPAPPQSADDSRKPEPARNENPDAQETSPDMDHANMRHGPVRDESDALSDMDHAGMGHDASPADEPREPIPALTDADRAAAFPPVAAHEHGRTIHSYFLADRLEVFDTDTGSGLLWKGIGWIGSDKDRLWLRTEGERSGGETESADIEVLYGRSISPWWDVVAGVRHDFKPDEAQTFAAIGLQGLAPQKFEVEATAYLGESGRTAARLEVEYDLLLSNRLILQPLVEINLYGENDPLRGVGSGLSSSEIGFRLRYEFTRKFAPYAGVVYERAYGDTADYRRNDSKPVEDTRIVFGIRTWF
ncbi:MAG: copper resistance protein B [Pseudomonadota bacterium]